MLQMLNSTVAMLLALALLLILLLGPISAVWLAFSIRRSLSRIADALEHTNRAELDAARAHWQATLTETPKLTAPIANSMFGR